LANNEGYLSRFFGIGAAKYPAAKVRTGALSKLLPTAQLEVVDSWWDRISSIISYSVANKGPKERNKLSVTGHCWSQMHYIALGMMPATTRSCPIKMEQ
jgi:hypothetical protein